MASLEQIAACRAPLARKAWPRSSIDGKASPATVAMPPASNRLRANAARAANSSWRPSVHRKTRGRSPVEPGWRRCAPAAARSPRPGGSVGIGRIDAASPSTAGSGDWIGAGRLAQVGELGDAGDRLASAGDIAPRAACGSPPPAPAASPGAAPPASRRGARPPGPATRPSWPAPRSAARRTSCRRPDRARGQAALSSSRTSWVLRAMRRASGEGRPSAWSNGSTVMLPAPPAAAANAATVPRRMFTCGSTRVNMRVGRLGVNAQRGHRGAGACDLQHLPPEPAQCAELRERQEEIGVGREREPDLARGGRRPAGLRRPGRADRRSRWRRRTPAPAPSLAPPAW